MKLLPFEERWAGTIGHALVPRGALGGALDAIDIGARYAHECAISPWYAALAFRASLWLTWRDVQAMDLSRSQAIKAARFPTPAASAPSMARPGLITRRRIRH